MKFISAVTSIGSLRYHSNHDHQPQRMMVSNGQCPFGHPSGPAASRLPQKRDSRIPGPGVQKPVSQQHPSQLSGCNGRRGRTPSMGPVPSSSSTSSCSNHHQSKSCLSDTSSRRSSSPASNSSSLSLGKNIGSTSLIPGAPEIVINRRINMTSDKQRQSHYSRPSIRPPRPTSIPSAPNQPSSVATNGSTIPPGHFSPAKISQPVITPRSDSSQKLVKVSSVSNGCIGNGSGSLISKGKGSEFNVMRKSECQTTGRIAANNHQSSSPQHSNPSPSSSFTSSPPSSLPSTSPSTTSSSSSPHSVNGTSCINTNHMTNKENSSLNSSGPPSNEFHLKDGRSSNPMNCQSNTAMHGNGPVLSLLNSGGYSLPSSPAKMPLPSGNSLSRTTSPGHFISHNYQNRTNEDYHLSVYSDSECSSRKSKVNILYSYSPTGRSNNFTAISEIAGVIETSTNLSNNNSNLIENNSLLAKCCNKSQLESTSSFSPRKDQLASNVNPNMDRERAILNNSLRSSPIGVAENLPSNNISKFPSLRNLSSGQQSATNGSILTAIPSTAYIASQQFRRLSKNSDLRGSAASLLSASSNFSSAEDKQTIEIKKLRNELQKANEKIATLSTQLLTSTQMVTAFEQSLASTITRFQQLSVSSENKDREISRLKSTIDSLRKQCDSFLKEGTTSEQRNLDGINGDASDRESIRGSGAEGQHKMKKLKVRSVSKDRESDGSGPGWLRGSITRAFRKGRPRTRSGNDSGSDADSCSSRTNLHVVDQGFRSMPGTPVHTPRANVSNQIDEELTGLEVLELKNKLQEKERVLTDIRLEALSVAHQMDGLKDSNNRMRGEIETLRVENRRLQRMVQRQSITSSVGSLTSCADSALTFVTEGKENNLDKSPSEKRIKNFSSESDLDPLLNALMKLKDATGNN